MRDTPSVSRMGKELARTCTLSVAVVTAAGAFATTGALADGLPSQSLRPAQALQAIAGSNTGQIKLITRTRVYGRPYYRCRRFSFHCGFTRGRLRYRSTVVFRHGSRTATPGLQAVHAVGPDLRPVPAEQPAIVVVPALEDKTSGGRYIYNGLEVRVLEYSGGFARISAPSQVTRWVRADAVIPLK